MQKAAAEAGWIQPPLFERGSLMLRLLEEAEVEAIVPEAGKAALNQMLENERSQGYGKDNKAERAWRMGVFSFVCSTATCLPFLSL